LYQKFKQDFSVHQRGEEAFFLAAEKIPEEPERLQIQEFLGRKFAYFRLVFIPDKVFWMTSADLAKFEEEAENLQEIDPQDALDLRAKRRKKHANKKKKIHVVSPPPLPPSNNNFSNIIITPTSPNY
jgi:hypothetical protein